MWIKEVRQRRKLSQAALAKRVGIHRVHLARIEGEARMPSFRALERIARALGVTSEELLSGYRRKREAVAIRESGRRCRRFLRLLLGSTRTLQDRLRLERDLVAMLGRLRRRSRNRTRGRGDA